MTIAEDKKRYADWITRDCEEDGESEYLSAFLVKKLTEGELIMLQRCVDVRIAKEKVRFMSKNSPTRHFSHIGV